MLILKILKILSIIKKIIEFLPEILELIEQLRHTSTSEPDIDKDVLQKASVVAKQFSAREIQQLSALGGRK